MEKAIYGLAADLQAVHFDIKKDFTEYFTVNHAQFASNIALTVEHEPKQLVTTTKNRENGELILVKIGSLLFFKFIPTTPKGNRLYRYVKQQRLRKCSYIFSKLGNETDEKSEEKMAWVLDKNDKIVKKNAMIFEVCLTNTPRDANTFCTTNVNHPLLRGINWETNIKATEHTNEHWDSYSEQHGMFDSVEKSLKDFDKKIKKVMKEKRFLK